MALPPLPRVVVCLISAASLCACYDHRFTQQIMEQRRQAKQAEGAKIRPSGGVHAVKHEASVKLYVAADYRRQHPEWKEPLRDLIDEANAVLIPTFGVRLEVSQIAEWTPACDGSELDPCLAELTQLDAGGPGVWVIGVLGAQSRFTTSFDELGRASLPGNHCVLRDVSDLAERDAIDRAFASMPASRREEIYRHRKHHKRLAILLHEWAHTLGATHSAESSSLLHPSYDDRMSAYDVDNADRMTQALAQRFTSGGGASAPVAATHPEQGASAAAATSGYVMRGSEDQLLTGLSAADRARYKEAAARARSESADSVYAQLEPLVERYPDCLAVQHLACGLLMQLGRQSEVQTVCARVQRLSRTQH